MDKIKFATLIGYISSIVRGQEMLEEYQVEAIDRMINDEMPLTAGKVKTSDIDALLAVMGVEGRKIDAIRQYRALTGVALKESKDTIEKYWPRDDGDISDV